MTDKKTEALKLALEALVKTDAEPGSKAWEREVEAITAIREALAEQPASKQRHISYVCPQCHWSLDEQPAQQQEPVDFTSLLSEAEEIVRGKPVWKRFIDGTPLENDIAVWMADFAQQHTSPPANANAGKPWVGLTDEEKAWCGAPTLQETVARVEAKLKEKNT